MPGRKASCDREICKNGVCLPRLLQRLARRGELERVGRGLYRHPDAPLIEHHGRFVPCIEVNHNEKKSLPMIRLTRLPAALLAELKTKIHIRLPFSSMKAGSLFVLALACAVLSGCRSTAPEPASSEVRYAGNPVFEGWYADPEGMIFGDKYWIYPTYSAPYGEQVFLDDFSSPNLVDWTKHSRIIDTSAVDWAERAMWAPAVVKKGEEYYLFFAANDLQSNEETGGIGVAVADSPAGPFKDHLGEPLIDTFYNGAQPIDQFIFQDGGEYYILYGGWGHLNIGRLNDDFTGLVPFEDGSLVHEITPEGYVEGAFMLKRNEKYYLMWSEGAWTGDDYRVAYGIADSPFGPFERIGIILEQDPDIATGAGHHSVIKAPDADKWYIVYHRRPIPNEGINHRVVAIDRMYFNDDGTIRPVRMTNKGVAAHPLD